MELSFKPEDTNIAVSFPTLSKSQLQLPAHGYIQVSDTILPDCTDIRRIVLDSVWYKFASSLLHAAAGSVTHLKVNSLSGDFGSFSLRKMNSEFLEDHQLFFEK